MDALASMTHVRANVPSWLLSLDDLLLKIDARQIELAALADATTAGGTTQSPRSVRPHGSTESLRPAAAIAEDSATAFPTPPTDHNDENTAPTSPTPAHRSNGAAIAAIKQQQQSQAQTRRKRKTPNTTPAAPATGAASIASAVSGNHKYRTRSMIIVYYDSAVQEAFEALVRNIASARNNIRKGKMAARMSALSSSTNRVPSMMYTRAAGRRGGGGPGGEVYDVIDARLDASQSTCETAAHQFLRDGDCTLEIETIRRTLGEARVLAEGEEEKLLREKEAKAARAAAEEKEETKDAATKNELDSDNASRPASLGPLQPQGVMEVDSDEN